MGEDPIVKPVVVVPGQKDLLLELLQPVEEHPETRPLVHGIHFDQPAFFFDVQTVYVVFSGGEPLEVDAVDGAGVGGDGGGGKDVLRELLPGRLGDGADLDDLNVHVLLVFVEPGGLQVPVDNLSVGVPFIVVAGFFILIPFSCLFFQSSQCQSLSFPLQAEFSF